MAKLSLVHIRGGTYYIPSPTNVGVVVNDNDAVLIDSGNDKEAGRHILRLLNEQNWNLKMVVNTHSNADHIGGNAFLQEKTNCGIAATQLEAAFINDPVLECSFLYGGFPFKDLKNKFLMAKPSRVTSTISSTGEIPDTGLQAVPLPGHYFDMIGVRTPDNIFFIADSLFPENILSKYHLFFLLDIRSHLDTLDRLKTIEADLFVPSHGEPLKQVDSLAEINKAKVIEIMNNIAGVCDEPVNVEDILQRVCSLYEIELNATQYVLASSTIRSFLTYLYEEGRLNCSFDNGKIMWTRIL